MNTRSRTTPPHRRFYGASASGQPWTGGGSPSSALPRRVAAVTAPRIEVGWASGQYHGLIVPEPTQARYLDDLYRLLLAERRSLKLLGSVWFAYRDRRSRPGNSYRRYWGNNTGLLRVNSSPKPAWRTFTTRARSGY